MTAPSAAASTITAVTETGKYHVSATLADALAAVIEIVGHGKPFTTLGVNGVVSVPSADIIRLDVSVNLR